MTLEEHFLQRLLEVKGLFARKQADYGPMNIAVAGERGVAVRVNDKVQRLLWLLDNRTPQNESLRDSWLDIADYGIIGLLVHDGLWPTGGEDASNPTCPTCHQHLPRLPRAAP